jgi:hypothetical protein
MTGVALSRSLQIGGSASIHTNGDLSTNIIFTSTSSSVHLLSTISNPIYVTPYDYRKGRLVLYGVTNVVNESYRKFCLPDTQYTLNGIGRIVPKGETLTYYVGGMNESDGNDGLSSTSPFATLEQATLAIANGSGTIIVQSDLSLDRPVLINGNITIKSDGSTHTIKRDTKYSFYQSGSCNIWSMIIVYGMLTLGDNDNTNIMQGLNFDAYLNKNIYTDGSAETVYIEVGAEVIMNKGIALQNNNSGAAILNKGNFNMFGGLIWNNEGSYVGGVYNCQNGIFTMSGGSIEQNYTQGSNIDGVKYGSGGVFNKDNSSFIMTGGIISYNKGYSCGGVYNGTNCTFHMAGGRLEQYSNPDDNYAYGIFNDIGADFIIEQNALIKAEDDICLVAGSKITINSRYTSEVMIITPVKLNTSSKRFEANYVPGTQLITNGIGYNFGENELNFVYSLSSTDYQINDQGILVKKLKESWVSLPQGTDYTYTGSAITPTVTIVDGTTILQQGIDYTVTYSNNLSAGLKIITITGKDNYVGICTMNYSINPTVATSVITEITDKFYSSDNGYNLAQLKNTLHNSVEVQISGGKGNLSVNWLLTGGTFDYRGGNYTFTGTLRDSNSILAGGLTLTTHVTVTPVVAKVITYNDILVPIGTNKTATANDLGESILPTSCSYNQEGTYESGDPNSGVITYTIDWGNKTLNTTSNKSTTTFVGSVTYVNYPKWLTIPENVTVSRTVGVTGKIIVDIKCDIDGKTYDGKPVIAGTPSNKQGYTGGYEILYVSTDGKGYSSKIAPKNAGNYKCIISITDDLTSYTGSKEIYFSIFKKNITINADNKTILLNDPLPIFTYHYEEGKGLISGETLIVEPTLSAPSANTGKVSAYSIKNVGADAGENYTILLVDGVLSVKAPTTPVIPPSSGGNSAPGGGGGTPSGGGGAPMGGAVTPSVSPTPTVMPNNDDINSTSGKIRLIGSDKEVSVSINKDEQKGSLNILLDLAEDEILTQKNQNGSQNQPIDITIPINSEELLIQVKNKSIKDINCAITIPKSLQNSENVGNINCVLGKELFMAARDDNKDISVSVSDEEGKEQYAWTFTGNNLVELNQDIEDVNLSLDVEAINDTDLKELLSNSDSKGKDGDEQRKGLVINFSHHGDLPSQASVRIYVGSHEGIKSGDKVLLYYYNSETNKLDSLPYSSGYTVDAVGYVTVQILHCSNYVLLTKAPDNRVVTALIDQISAYVTEKTLYLGGTTGFSTDYIITLPSTLEWVPKNDKTSSTAVGAVNIAFTSNNPKVATVDNLGHITAQSIGTCTISAKVILYSGKTKIYKTTFSVKEPYIDISKSKKTMKVGDTFSFEVKIYGFKKENIKWSTSKKSIIDINSKTGKVTAVSSGVDYIVAEVGNKKIKLKVVVSQ